MREPRLVFVLQRARFSSKRSLLFPLFVNFFYCLSLRSYRVHTPCQIASRWLPKLWCSWIRKQLVVPVCVVPSLLWKENKEMRQQRARYGERVGERLRRKCEKLFFFLFLEVCRRVCRKTEPTAIPENKPGGRENECTCMITRWILVSRNLVLHSIQAGETRVWSDWKHEKSDTAIWSPERKFFEVKKAKEEAKPAPLCGPLEKHITSQLFEESSKATVCSQHLYAFFSILWKYLLGDRASLGFVWTHAVPVAVLRN